MFCGKTHLNQLGWNKTAIFIITLDFITMYAGNPAICSIVIANIIYINTSLDI